MLNTFLPAFFFSWATVTIIFRFLKPNLTTWLRIPLRMGGFILAFILGMIGGLAVFALSLWAMSGLSFGDFLNAPLDTKEFVSALARNGGSGSLVGAAYAIFKKWPQE